MEEAKEEEEVMVVPPPAAEEPAEAPATDPPPPPPPTELLGRNQWHGFRLAPEEVTKPTDEFRLKFPPMASCLCGDEKSLIIMAGGGGSSRAGIPNAIVFGGLSDGGQCNQTAHHGTGLEAVTSLSADVTTGVMATVQSDRVKLYRMAIGDDAFDATVKERAAAAEEAAGDGEEAVPIPVHDKPHLGCLVGKARELDVLPAGALPLTLKDGEELPAERKPYVVALSPTGNLLAVGMEDGALLIFGLSKAKGGGLNDWSLITRAKSHTKEIKSLCFSYSGATLATAAPDGQCLLWQAPPATGGTMPEPKPVSRPRFWFAGPNQKPRKNASAKKKADALLTQWRCVAMPSDPPKSSRGRLLLYGALNHAGGPGWVAKCDATSGRWQAKGKASNSMLTTLAVSPDGRLVVTGSSEGELICMDGASLQRLLRLVPHDLFITNLLLRATAEPTGVAALEAATEAAGPPQVTYTAITCAGDNSIRLTQLTPARLKKGSGDGQPRLAECIGAPRRDRIHAPLLGRRWSWSCADCGGGGRAGGGGGAGHGGRGGGGAGVEGGDVVDAGPAVLPGSTAVLRSRGTSVPRYRVRIERRKTARSRVVCSIRQAEMGVFAAVGHGFRPVTTTAPHAVASDSTRACCRSEWPLQQPQPQPRIAANIPVEIRQTNLQNDRNASEHISRRHWTTRTPPFYYGGTVLPRHHSSAPTATRILLCGPSGAGKTFLVRSLTTALSLPLHRLTPWGARHSRRQRTFRWIAPAAARRAARFAVARVHRGD